MNLFISFEEIKMLASKRTGLIMNLEYVDADKFKVSTFIKLPLIGEREISLLLAIKSASFDCVQLRNDSGIVSNMILNMLEDIAERIFLNTSSTPNKLVDIGNNSMEIYPNVIEKVKEIERFLVMHSIVVVDKGFAINFSCREN